jgi:putative addiction module antidote
MHFARACAFPATDISFMTTFGTANMIAQSVNVNFPDLRLWQCLCYNIRMNKPIKVIKVGNSAGMILPKEILAKLRVSLGDDLYLTETANGFHLTPSDPGFEAKMALAETIMREDRDILRVLAQ